jgi:hypothetical protein
MPTDSWGLLTTIVTTSAADVGSGARELGITPSPKMVALAMLH